MFLPVKATMGKISSVTLRMQECVDGQTPPWMHQCTAGRDVRGGKRCPTAALPLTTPSAQLQVQSLKGFSPKFSGFLWVNPGSSCRFENQRLSHLIGSFVGVTEVTSQGDSTAVLLSPTIRESSATCRLRLRYFLWDSGKSRCLASPTHCKDVKFSASC